MTEIINNFEEKTGNSSAVTNEALMPLNAKDFQLPAINDTSKSHLPALALNEKSASLASIDGPGRVTDNSLNGRNPRQEPAELGNAHHTVELIQRGGFQNADGSLTAAGAESIRAAVARAGAFPNVFQTYEGRTQQVQDYINQNVHPPVSLRFDRDHGNANTLTGSRPFITATVGGRQQRIPMER
jgi:hypothetical protein